MTLSPWFRLEMVSRFFNFRRLLAPRAILALVAAFVLVTPTARAAPPGVSLEMSGTWREIDPDGAPGLPTRRRGDAAIWDSRANRMFAFGGIAAGHGYRNDLWQYSGPSGWERLTENGREQAARGGFAPTIAWDQSRDRLLVFGGYSAGNALWEYSGSGGWRLLTAEGAPGSPPARWGQTAVWDTQRQRVLLFGGDVGQGLSPVSDLWEYSDAGGWRLIIDSNAAGGPRPRHGHIAVWDARSARMIVFGGSGTIEAGFSASSVALDDIWQYDAGQGWRQLPPGRGAPAPRWGHAATWDGNRERLVIFGGVDSSAAFRNDLWQWSDAAGWRQLSAEGANGAPARRTRAAVVWDTEVDRILVFGGQVESRGETNDLWEFRESGKSFHDLPLQSEPTPERSATSRAIVTGPAPSGVRGPAPLQASPSNWQIADDGAFVNAENATYKIRFAYNAKGQQGWFQGSGTGGGGKDGSIVELYHKPTDGEARRNLVFRNGTWGSGYDALDVWEADKTATDRATFDDPDTSSNRDGRVVAKSVRQEGGTLFADFTVEFASWRLARQYKVDAAGLITIKSDVEVVKDELWNYLGHRFSFAGNPYSFTNREPYNWGSDFQTVNSRYQSFTDGVNRLTGAPVTDSPKHFLADQLVRPFAQTNTVAHTHFNRPDAYSGFLIKREGRSPSIMVVQAAKSDWDGPFSAIPRRVAEHAQSKSKDYRSYIETALFSFEWAPNNLTQVGTTWFYMTTPGESPDGNIWDKRGFWSKDLGKWSETFYVIVDQGLKTDDYLPRWQQLTGN